MVGDNKDQLAQRLEETANRLLAVERTVAIGVPKAAQQEMEKLKQYVVPHCGRWYIMMNMSPSRILQEEMKKIKDLAHKSLAIRTLDHEEYQKIIGQIFRRVNGATTSFQVHTLIFI